MKHFSAIISALCCAAPVSADVRSLCKQIIIIRIIVSLTWPGEQIILTITKLQYNRKTEFSQNVQLCMCTEIYYNTLRPYVRGGGWRSRKMQSNAIQFRIVSSVFAAIHRSSRKIPFPSSVVCSRKGGPTTILTEMRQAGKQRAFAIHFSVCAFTSRCRNEEWVELRAWTDPWTNGGHHRTAAAIPIE